MDKSGSLPKTVIRREGSDDRSLDKTFLANEPIKLTIKQLLDLTGIDLDKRLNEQDNKAGLTSAARGVNQTEFPFARLSGINLIMNFQYFHRSLATESDYKASVGDKSKEVICLVDVAPQFVWSKQGADVQFQISNPNHPFFINPERERLNDTEQKTESVQVDFQRNGVLLTFQISGKNKTNDFRKVFAFRQCWKV